MSDSREHDEVVRHLHSLHVVGQGVLFYCTPEEQRIFAQEMSEMVNKWSNTVEYRANISGQVLLRDKGGVA